MKRTSPILGLIVLVGFVGCAYRVGDSRTSGQKLKFFVPVIENRTARKIDADDLTGLLRERLEQVHGIEVVHAKENCDFLVLARVVGIDRTWGPAFFKGDATTEARGGLKRDAISAESAKISLTIILDKLLPSGERLSSQTLVEDDLYQLAERIESSQGSAAAPQIHASREKLLIRKLADGIFRRATPQIVDIF